MTSFAGNSRIDIIAGPSSAGKGIRNFGRCKVLVDSWQLYDNSDAPPFCWMSVDAMKAPVSHSKDPGRQKAPQALMSASEKARQLAEQTGTSFVVRKSAVTKNGSSQFVWDASHSPFTHRPHG